MIHRIFKMIDAMPTLKPNKQAAYYAGRTIGIPIVRTKLPPLAEIDAFIVPLIVFATRFRIYAGLWVNDFLVVVVALYCLIRYSRKGFTSSPFIRFFQFFCAYSILHSLLLCLAEGTRQNTLLGNAARMLTVAFAITGISAMYRTLPVTIVIAGLRRVGYVIGASVIVHCLGLNGLLGLPPAVFSWDSTDRSIYFFDLGKMGFARGFGIASEPFYAAAYLMLIGTLIILSSEPFRMRTQVFLMTSSLFTVAANLALYIPAWLLVLVLRRRQMKVVAWTAVAICMVTLLTTQTFVGERLTRRYSNISEGSDASANMRMGPTIRSIAATFRYRPLGGYGLGNSDYASDDGYNLISAEKLTNDGYGNFSGIGFVEFFACLGLPGLFFFVGFVLYGIHANSSWGRQLLFAFCLIAAGNAYMVTHVQFFYLCLLTQGLLVRRRRLPRLSYRVATTASALSYGSFAPKSSIRNLVKSVRLPGTPAADERSARNSIY